MALNTYLLVRNSCVLLHLVGCMCGVIQGATFIYNVFVCAACLSVRIVCSASVKRAFVLIAPPIYPSHTIAVHINTTLTWDHDRKKQRTKSKYNSSKAAADTCFVSHARLLHWLVIVESSIHLDVFFLNFSR